MSIYPPFPIMSSITYMSAAAQRREIYNLHSRYVASSTSHIQQMLRVSHAIIERASRYSVKMQRYGGDKNVENKNQ